MKQTTGIYVHIPFCASKCPYCDFYSLPFDDMGAEHYRKALLRALAYAPLNAGTPDTLYFGGGTPSLMKPAWLKSVIVGVAQTIGLSPGAEITLEANPGTLSPALLGELLEAGFTRISFGVQSLQQDELTALGRRHTPQQAAQAVEAAHRAGFRHCSADLMLGIPRQTRESLAATLDALCALPLDHVSAYLLKVEESTPLGKRTQTLNLPSDDDAAALYLQCVRTLEQAGFGQYEISNFAKPGGESRHNLKYWLSQPYLGLGPGAHSFWGGQRFYFPRDLAAFTGAENPFSLAINDGEGGGFEEYAMLRLRLRSGLNLAHTEAVYGTPAAELKAKAVPLIKGGLVRLEQDVLSLTPEGFLLSNAVTGALLF